MSEKLREAIDALKIIDNHGHPGFAVYFQDVPEDKRVAFAVDPFKTPKESAGGFPYLEELHYEAYEKFYGFSRDEIDNGVSRKDLEARYLERKKDLPAFLDELMEAAGVETLIANYAIPKCLENRTNIRFIPCIDSLIFPFDNGYLKERTLGKSFIGSYEHFLEELKAKHGYRETGFEGYLEFVDRALEGYVADGVAGFKFSIAYARTTYFEKIDPKQGPRLYQAARDGDRQSYHQLQDLLMWLILRRILRLDMPVQFHFSITDNYVNYFDPLNISNILEDEELKQAKIVILHGGYPRYQNAELLALGGLTPNNVHIDFSGRVMFANHPKIIAGMLRTWLEKPVLWDKLLYGSDVLWGERYLYTSARTGRDAVYYALDGMIRDGILDEETSISIARKVLRENAKALYRL